MKKNAFTLALATAIFALSGCGGSDDKPFSFAAFADVPYGADLVQFKAMPAFIASINADKDLSFAMHGGDIHSGSEPCTLVFDQAVAKQFGQFTIPLVYTPGDNEWADCQKAKQMNGKFSATAPELGYAINTTIPSYANGNPVDNLKLVRNLFFSKPGQTLGATMSVRSQAQEGKTDVERQFVENTWFMQSGVLIATVNIPGGSNNGTDPWWAAASVTDAQNQEVANRTAATKAWLTHAFDQAASQGATAMVILTQADMWSWEEPANSARLADYKPYIDIIADRTARFGKPVLLLNGDTHLFRSDNPLLPGAPCVAEVAAAGSAAQACAIDPYTRNAAGASYAVRNFQRVVFHGSTLPMEWLKLKVDPAANAAKGAYAYGPFSWERKSVR